MRKIATVPIVAGIALVTLAAFVSTERPAVQLIHSDDCSTVELWQEDLAAHGFDIQPTLIDELTLSEQRAMRLLPDEMRDCKMASIAGYHVIGDVSADDIIHLLRRKPLDVLAIAHDSISDETVALHHDGTLERKTDG